MSPDEITGKVHGGLGLAAAASTTATSLVVAVGGTSDMFHRDSNGLAQVSETSWPSDSTPK
jgi:hypothetical protein